MSQVRTCQATTMSFIDAQGEIARD
jgi:hypothetical protein